jgi:energy-coupling factor transporter ATP-binding protein EcfA2
MEIKFDKVNFTYKKINYCEHEVLKNINIKLKAGKINAIVGKSGSGKTTLLELITGILKPTTGKVLIDEKKIDNLNNAFDIGYVSQDNNQFLQKTVKDELEMLLKLYNYKLKEKKKRINDSLIMVGLNEKYLNLNINNLSSGEKKKLALASALILNPSILIIDEPVIGLDRKTKEELKKIFRILKTRYNKTIIFVSNNLDFVLEVADYVYVLYDKEIVLEGKKIDVLSKTDILKKYGIIGPNITSFESLVLTKKQIKIGYRYEINDLIKDIYRCSN